MSTKMAGKDRGSDNIISSRVAFGPSRFCHSQERRSRPPVGIGQHAIRPNRAMRDHRPLLRRDMFPRAPPHDATNLPRQDGWKFPPPAIFEYGVQLLRLDLVWHSQGPAEGLGLERRRLRAGPVLLLDLPGKLQPHGGQLARDDLPTR